MSHDELHLRIYGDPVLRSRSEEIEDFGPDLKALAERMFQVMYEEEGVGLAGPQIGVGRRIAVFDVPLEEGGSFTGTLINPRILEFKGSQKGGEGCLSVPGFREDVTRHDWLRVEALDLDGKPVSFECTQLLSRAVQHEIDHLNGVFFVDRVNPVRRSLLAKKLKKLAAEQGEATE
jgi:peptide deformylase